MVAALGTCVPGIAAAQPQLSMEVTPLRVELKMMAKAAHTQAITLRNDSSAAVHVRARVDEYWLSLDGTPQFKFATPGEPYSAAPWVRLNPSELTIQPGTTATVRATTSVPADAFEGSYRCAVMFEFDPPGLDSRTARKDMQFRGRVATLIYATVGNPKPGVELADLQALPTKSGMPDIVALLTNSGRAYVRTKGTMIITMADGRPVRDVPLPSVPVLPESRRELRVPTVGPQDPPLQPGSYKIEIRIDVGQTALLVGETTFEVAGAR
jgi:mannose-6-phosphate isomerase-like protein (cupin superfamily)